MAKYEKTGLLAGALKLVSILAHLLSAKWKFVFTTATPSWHKARDQWQSH